MLDMDKAEANALGAVYPGIIIHWCSFHVAEAVGRNVRDKDRQISPNHQKEMITLFSAAHKANGKTEAKGNLDKLINRCKAMGHQAMADYFTNTFAGDFEKWTYAHHTYLNRGSTTNNYSESHMLTVKSQVLERMKSYNVVALVDYIADRLDNIYSDRLEKFSSGEINARIREINGHIDKISSSAKNIPTRYVIGQPPQLQVI